MDLLLQDAKDMLRYMYKIDITTPDTAYESALGLVHDEELRMVSKSQYMDALTEIMGIGVDLSDTFKDTRVKFAGFVKQVVIQIKQQMKVIDVCKAFCEGYEQVLVPQPRKRIGPDEIDVDRSTTELRPDNISEKENVMTTKTKAKSTKAKATKAKATKAKATKIDQARVIFAKSLSLKTPRSRGKILELFQEKLDMTAGGAGTYYQTCRKEYIAEHGALPHE